ncbi:MAG: hypothetical protein WDZ49_13450 [Litorilinea sp.]
MTLNTIGKITRDMYLGNGMISVFYLLVMFAIQLVVVFVVPWLASEGEVSIYFGMSLGASTRIFMLILGFFAVRSYLTSYVALGVTRRSFFWGCAFSTTLLAYSFALLVSIVGWVNLQISASDMEMQVGSPGVTFLMNGMFYLLYYLVGWIIGLAFYNYRLWIGALSVLVGVMIVGLGEALSTEILSIGPIRSSLSLGLPTVVSVTSILILLFVMLFVLKTLTREVAVKV